MNTKSKIIVICGPTASGKTYVSIELAKILNAEIISADSMQIYKELNIGTAKPSTKEMSGIKHHLIDIISIKSEKFNVAEYVKLAGDCVCDILNRNKNVIICGGTGLYIDHFINNTKFTEYENDIEYRTELEKLPNDKLYSMLVEIDKKSSEIIHPNNKKRVIRALEIFKITGKPKSELDELANSYKSKYDFIKLGLYYSDRNMLYNKINSRVDFMIANGLIEEVRELYENGDKNNIRKTGAIGYVEISDYFNGLYNFEETVEKIKQNTRNYAKRQLTWFRKDAKTIWIDLSDINKDYNKNQYKIIENCLKYINL
ncbi:MAG: tRNA (adenosine(37)-N6)-dimethylallyltransferase MiaA [Oscillospiraceae bacterium]|nr:tRNA (adenosine(37)-N6)-dimethylallyltransferase MiaA [Oscillospiraceae bacterium]